MNPKVYFLNSDFEYSLISKNYFNNRKRPKILDAFDYCFLFCGNEHDSVLMNWIPDKSYFEFFQEELKWNLPKSINLEDLNSGYRNHDFCFWGMSENEIEWGQRHSPQLPKILNIDMLKKVNSKATSFLMRNSLGFSEQPSDLFSSYEKLSQFIKKHSHKNLLLKAPLGVAGRNIIQCFGGKLEQREIKKIQDIIELEGEILVEPFREKIIDLGTQFWIHEDGTLEDISFNEILCQKNGSYIGARVGDFLIDETINTKWRKEFYNQACAVRKKVGNELYEQGYWGPCGIDSMIYRSGDEIKYQPLSEINARYGMGLVADFIKKRIFKNQMIADWRHITPSKELLKSYPIEFSDWKKVFSEYFYNGEKGVIVTSPSIQSDPFKHSRPLSLFVVSNTKSEYLELINQINGKLSI